jgi:glycosyltransferase involved in cell wall biosynthesis
VHIIIHTQYYPPEIGAPQARLSELAEGLARRGYKVTVLTGMPSYPTGKIFAGYGGLLRIEERDGVKIIRTYSYPTQSAQLTPRLFNYFSFVFSSLLSGMIFLQKGDYLLTESPPLFLGISGYLLSWLKGAKWIFNVSDLWPESVVRLGALEDGVALQIARRLERLCYQKAWLVSGQSKSILDDILERFPDIKTYHLSNGVNPERFFPVVVGERTNEAAQGANEIVAFYGGLHGLAQGLDQIIYAAQKIQAWGETRIKFVLVGDGPEKQMLQRLASELVVDNVIFLEPVEKRQIPGMISLADICIVPLKIYLPGAVPSKLYESMASGKPVILIAEGEAAEIVRSANAGVVVQPGDIEGLAQAIVEMAADGKLRQRFGEAGRQAVTENFDRRNIIDLFVAYLQNERVI